jgi:hypothetical protein
MAIKDVTLSNLKQEAQMSHFVFDLVFGSEYDLAGSGGNPCCNVLIARNLYKSFDLHPVHLQMYRCYQSHCRSQVHLQSR